MQRKEVKSLFRMYANFDMNIAAPTSVVILMCEYLLKFIKNVQLQMKKVTCDGLE
jgi:hypothetical protein